MRIQYSELIFLSIVVERDWIVQLAEENPSLLAQTNAVMQRIDLVCKVMGPSVVGFLVWVRIQDTSVCVITCIASHKRSENSNACRRLFYSHLEHRFIFSRSFHSSSCLSR